VFRDAEFGEIERVARVARLDLVQLHGSETDELVNRIALPVIKAFRVGDALPPIRTAAEWVMFDSGGGTGRTFDWSRVSGYRGKPFFLAGGITPENVVDAITTVRPDAIDLSSGVEAAPGIKDHDKMRKLFERVRR
jgi:phosphoribosylanthranilate isomerase